MRRIALVLLAATVALSAAACGGGEGNGPATPGATGSPAPGASPAATPTRGPVAPARYCQMGQEPNPLYNVQVTARWKGKDRVVIEGSVHLPGPASVSYWICQDGEFTASLVQAIQPTFKDGKISAESKLVEVQVGPVFDPDARFEVVLLMVGEPIHAPYLTIRIPVEGKPG